MEMAKFENRFLTPIQGFTQSKIEKAKLISKMAQLEDSERTKTRKHPLYSIKKMLESKMRLKIEKF